jgi:SAM-dependent methyltransferase
MADPLPLLDRLLAGGRHVRLLIHGPLPPDLVMPDPLGCERVARVSARPQPGGVVAHPCRLPFVEALFDRALVMTALPSPRGELRELWRVLSPAGLALLLLPVRRGWPWKRHGWTRDLLEPQLEDMMFEMLAWQSEIVPRTSAALIGKRDGLRPALVGLAEPATEAAPALRRENNTPLRRENNTPLRREAAPPLISPAQTPPARPGDWRARAAGAGRRKETPRW